MAQKQVELQLDDVRLGDEFETGFMALANRKEIKESGRLFLQVFGDQLEHDRRRKSRKEGGHRAAGRAGGETTNLDHRSRLHGFSRQLQRVVDIVDTVLEWLEHSGKNVVMDLKKHEMVLRGVFHLTDLGNQASVFAALESASSFLDKPSDAFPAQRDVIRNNLKDIEKMQKRIEKLVDEAGETLRAIIDDAGVDKRKGVQFDNIVREARLEIRACRRRLGSNEKKINELSTKMNTIKWFSRAFRFVGCGLTWCWLYQRYRESDFFVLKFWGSSSVATAIWLSIYPSQTYEFHRSLSELDLKHSELTEKLEILREKLRGAKDYSDGLVNLKTDGHKDSTV